MSPFVQKIIEHKEAAKTAEESVKTLSSGSRIIIGRSTF